MHQITEDNLGELERTIPQLAEELMTNLSTRHKVQLRRVQRILSDVRWNYGPPSQVATVDPDAGNEELGADQTR